MLQLAVYIEYLMDQDCHRLILRRNEVVHVTSVLANTFQVQPKPFPFDLKARAARQKILDSQYDAVWGTGAKEKTSM